MFTSTEAMSAPHSFASARGTCSNNILGDVLQSIFYNPQQIPFEKELTGTKKTLNAISFCDIFMRSKTNVNIKILQVNISF